MCIIIVKDQPTPPTTNLLKKASEINPHGLGVYWIDTQRIQYFESSEFNVLETKRPYIAHFRLATVGAVSRENCHPFEIKQPNNRNNLFLFQNGTVRGIGSKKKTDTQALAELLTNMKEWQIRGILSTYNCRFVTVEPDAKGKGKSYKIYNREDWFKQDGILYSKANCFTYKIAVYGTLKKGGTNSHRLHDSEFIGAGKTANKHLMSRGKHGFIPFMSKNVNNVKGHNCHVEVYEVDTSTLADIDRLEAHPTWYKRELTPIILNNGERVDAYVYFNSQGENGEPFANFEQGRRRYNHYGYNRYNHDHSLNVPKVNPMASKYKPKRNTDADKSWQQFYDDYNII